MPVTIALAGNPNSGKTTMFNALTGSSQRVGNWPGVTVDKKEGRLKKYKDVTIIDLPGIYSLSPYTLEEVISRDYLVNEKPDVIINIVDGSNIERNLYLTTQILDVGIPVVIALNMIDIVNKSGDIIDIKKLSETLSCPVIETSAQKGTGLEALTKKAIELAKSGKKGTFKRQFSKTVELALSNIAELIKNNVPDENLRWYSIKFFERDEKVLERITLSDVIKRKIEQIILACEEELDDNSASIIASESYEYISDVVRSYVKKSRSGTTLSDKIDSVVTSRWLGLPIFTAIMFLVYYVSVSTVGSYVTDFTNDMFVGEWIQAPLADWLTSIGTTEWMIGLIVDGIVGGLGAIIGFLPQMLILFFFLAILEDSGYMARIAFLMDRIFRKIGLSGKSFIPLLIGTGCGVPGIMAARTIEQQNDRRMTIMTTTFMPCGAKLPLIALISSAVFGGTWWVAPSAYFLGIGAVVISGIILKKTKLFMGESSPFVIELPAYHIPMAGNVIRSMFERGSSFVKKAFTVYTLASILVWFGASFGFVNGTFGLVDNLNNSVLHNIGNSLALIFAPLGFGRWETTVASIMGLAAKEQVVGVFGVLTSIGNEDLALEMVDSANVGGLSPIAALFSSGIAAYSFLIFNLLCAPCFAAMNTIRTEMNNWKWTVFAIGYECIFAYVIALIFYQLGTFFSGGSFTAGTTVAFILLAVLLFMLFRPAPKQHDIEKSDSNLSATAGVSE
ncbi:ferrous iron transport protein B [Methanosarcina sp.]|uniref:ferrous iron transport protein B n=1 Tax=Methanosarcina sp. TaxID=2213 RepID=UPI0029884CA5|nr:ferrous iron transport protein B [Methanosarcina sp.]MDW5549581.1 ferrous iron transport protein B [Methanosarcina sp.]MDW5553613.1 ferrous iron transport protein B [Methanosarcina sp.]MDW5558581.1 ferrous iron transport protein B [Methanosarcina sp.]